MADATEEKKETEEVKPTVAEMLSGRGTQTQDTINTAYDASLNTRRQDLLDAYNQNTAAQAQQGQSIQQQFQQAQNDINVQNARNDQNLTQFANVRDVNTGLGSQHRLNLGNASARSNATIDYARQQALQENARQAELMTTNYQNQVAAALKDNDYKRAAALFDDYNNQNAWREQQAQILASYGNFEGYKPLYGDEAAEGMQNIWNAQNPKVAYRMGRISAEKFKQITGSYPRGYTPPGGGWYFGGWGGLGGGDSAPDSDAGNGGHRDNWQNIPLPDGTYYTGTW